MALLVLVGYLVRLALNWTLFIIQQVNLVYSNPTPIWAGRSVHLLMGLREQL